MTLAVFEGVLHRETGRSQIFQRIIMQLRLLQHDRLVSVVCLSHPQSRLRAGRILGDEGGRRRGGVNRRYVGALEQRSA